MRSSGIFTLFLSGSECLTGVFNYGGVDTIFYREDFPESFEVKKANCESVGGQLADSKDWFLKRTVIKILNSHTSSRSQIRS